MIRSIGKNLIRNEGPVVATLGLGCLILTPAWPPFGLIAATLIITGVGLTP